MLYEPQQARGVIPSDAGGAPPVQPVGDALLEAFGDAGDRIVVLTRAADVLVPGHAGWCVLDVAAAGAVERLAALPRDGQPPAQYFPPPPRDATGILGRLVTGTARYVLTDGAELGAGDGTWESSLADLAARQGGPVLTVVVPLGQAVVAALSLGQPGHGDAEALEDMCDLLPRMLRAATESLPESTAPMAAPDAAGLRAEELADELRNRAARQHGRARFASEARDVESAAATERPGSNGGHALETGQRAAELHEGSARLVRLAADLHYQLAARQSDRRARRTDRAATPGVQLTSAGAGGVPIPLVGLGTWQVKGAEAYSVARLGLQLGHRHIDTATVYGNQKAVGHAIADSGVPRSEVVLTTKLPPFDVGRERRTLEESLTDLGVDVIDFWLLHWTLNGQAQPDVWRRMARLRDEGMVRAIGVSNYGIAQLDELIQQTGVTPAVNQVPWGPMLHRTELVTAHLERGVLLTGFSPLNSTRMHDPVLTRIAKRHGVDVGQVVLRWHVQRGIPTLVRSRRPERIRSNLDVYRFELTQGEVRAIDELH